MWSSRILYCAQEIPVFKLANIISKDTYLDGNLTNGRLHQCITLKSLVILCLNDEDHGTFGWGSCVWHMWCWRRLATCWHSVTLIEKKSEQARTIWAIDICHKHVGLSNGTSSATSTWVFQMALTPSAMGQIGPLASLLYPALVALMFLYSYKIKFAMPQLLRIESCATISLIRHVKDVVFVNCSSIHTYSLPQSN